MSATHLETTMKSTLSSAASSQLSLSFIFSDEPSSDHFEELSFDQSSSLEIVDPVSHNVSSYDWATELDLYEKSLIYNQRVADSKILRRLQCSNVFDSVKADFDEALQLENEGDFEFDFA